jgi:hypothetical protein
MKQLQPTVNHNGVAKPVNGECYWTLDEILLFEDALGVLTIEQMSKLIKKPIADILERIDLFDLNPNKPHPLAAPPAGEGFDDFDPTYAVRKMLAARVRRIREMAGLESSVTYLSTKAALARHLAEEEAAGKTQKPEVNYE